MTLVYGGSSLGMMGLLANTVKECGGKVVGIITHHLIEQEKPLKCLDELYIVDSMQERKSMMQQISDMFIVMPGGLGTLEEAIETWNAIKIGELTKPIGFLNIN
ncbi:TIGR00730 family Rossman fold protein [Legionella quinlivanii]|nr:TIGR00730 family Rossman fold protein [Legionella quinlivanii]